VEEAQTRSFAQCLGKNPMDSEHPERRKEMDWIFHSCSYHNLCYAPKEGRWLLFTGDKEKTDAVPVSIGAINSRWTWDRYRGNSAWQMSFRPEDVPGPLPVGHPGFRWAHEIPELRSYMAHAQPGVLDSDVTWILYHSMAAHNFGHMMWDDLGALFLLQKLFGISIEREAASTEQKRSGHLRMPATALPVRFSFPEAHPIMWATCEFQEKNRKDKIGTCEKLLSQWLPALGLGNGNGTMAERSERQGIGKALAPPRMAHDIKYDPSVEYVCFPWAVAGIGMLSDHCTKLHGWDEPDFFLSTVCNYGKGGDFAALRNTMVRNLLPDLADGRKIVTTTGSTPNERVKREILVQLPPRVRRRMIFLIMSSTDGIRSLRLVQEIATAAERFPQWEVVVLNAPGRLTAAEQAYLTATSAVWVSACGGAAASAMLMPRGASVILFHGKSNRRRGAQLPAYLDWDAFSHMSHVNLVWLASPKMVNDRSAALSRFMEVLTTEVERLEAFMSFE